MDITRNNSGGDRLYRALAGIYPGCDFAYIPQTASTNTQLKEQIQVGQLIRPTVLYTDWQSAGRGTRGRVWYQPAEDLQRLGLDLALSVAAPQAGPRLSSPRLSLLAGALVAVLVERGLFMHEMHPGGQVPPLWSMAGVKWPNDILVHTAAGWRKAGGLLIETTTAQDGARWVVIGMGLNVNSLASQFPPELAGQVSSLREWRAWQTGLPLEESFLERGLLLCHFAGELARFVLGEGLADAYLLRAWHSRNRTAGTRYTFTRGDEHRQVTAVEVDAASGGLWVADETGQRWLVASYSELSLPDIAHGSAL